MRHHNHNRKLQRTRNARRALLRSLAISLIDKNRIKTTEAKAKELRPFIERLVSRGKTNTLSSRRLALAELYNQTKTVKKLFSEVSPRYEKRTGGYTRITKLPIRKGDASKMAMIEFI